MSNYEIIEIGDVVRSYDFQGTDDCYILGEVVDIVEKIEENGETFPLSCKSYKIECWNRIFSGKVTEKHGTYYYAPLNGTRQMFADGCTNNVKKVDEYQDMDGI